VDVEGVVEGHWVTADSGDVESDQGVVHVETVAVPGAGNLVWVFRRFDVEVADGDVAVNGPTVWKVDLEPAIRMQRQLKVMEVDNSMMKPAQSNQVRDLRASTLAVFDDMVRVERAGVMAPGELAPDPAQFPPSQHG
jgi:hypothetical protein